MTRFANSLLVCAFLTGCATDRYLTKEEDAALRQACAPANDCVILRAEQWRLIQEFIAAHRGTSI